MLITISRQFGSGGAEVAKRVADRLQWRVADNEFVERVAVRAGLTPDEVACGRSGCQTSSSGWPGRWRRRRPSWRCRPVRRWRA